ncbi:MAG: M23 family metallopeptidase [Bacteroidota bacterium]
MYALRLIAIAALLLLNCHSEAQSDAAMSRFKITEEAQPDGSVQLYVLHQGFCPLTILLEFPELQNFEPSKPLPLHQVIHPKESKQPLLQLRRSSNKAAGYRYSYSLGMGNEIDTKHDDQYAYWLPYPSGSKHMMGQGNNGRFSHNGINAVDFNMDVGSKVCAARGGVIVDFKESSNQGCKSASCQEMANFLLIYHDDGSFGHYGHLKQNGVLVELGQRVKAGEAIALSGNTGWSSGPHLHFEVYIPKGTQQMTLPIKFLLSNGKRSWLEEGEYYTANHGKK